VVLFSFSLAGIFLDVHVLRGFCLGQYFFLKDYSGVNDNFDYNITENGDGSFDVELRNKTLMYYPVVAYRDGPFFRETNTSILRYAGRYELTASDSIVFDTGGGFDCGTGLHVVLIRPFESFRLLKVNAIELFDSEQYVYHLINVNGQRWEVPSVMPAAFNIRLYLPVAGFHEVDRRVYSNVFVINSKVLIEKMHELKSMYQ
jgi:hypothetical protein